MAFKAVNNFGLDAELAQKMQDKYDKGLEAKIQVWLEEVTGAVFDKDFGDMIQDGIILCELVNKMLPGRIKKINTAGGLFKMQENVTSFIKVCRDVGVPEASLFPTESLSQKKDLGQVLVCINAFSSVMQRNQDRFKLKFNGPWLGPPLSKAATDAAAAATADEPEYDHAAHRAAQSGKRKSKWEVKPGGSAGATSLLNQGSAGVMERLKLEDPREQIKRNELDGKGATSDISAWNAGSSKMERQTYVDAREEIKRNRLDGKGTNGEVSALNNGSKGMERLKLEDPREMIKRGEL